MSSVLSPSTAPAIPAKLSGRLRIIDYSRVDAAAERQALIAGLRGDPACIAPKYLYDALGAALYAAICELPEYYPTRTERAIFTEHRPDIVTAVGCGTELIDLGAGDGAKAALWVPALAPRRYVAVDIAPGSLRQALARLSSEFPTLEILGVATDFTCGLDLPHDLGDAPMTFFYPGSSIGNFTPQEASRFLAAIRSRCTVAGSGLLIGVDTPKDSSRLVAAYDDRLGVTAAFNRNILLHVNRVLGCDFDAGAFAHVAIYDSAHRRIEMHLQATRDCTVQIDGARRRFARGERIHTESSYKYAPRDFTAMLRAAGFDSVRLWQDDAGDFALYYAR